MNYEIDVQIDESALDVEWLNQSSLAMKYGRNWAECYRKNQQAEEHIKLTRSKLIKEVTNVEGKPPTGPVIEAFYRNHKKHIKAKEEWVETQYQLNIADIAKKEIGVTRKAALQNLVELHKQQYFAGPSIPRDLSFETTQKEKQKRSDKGVASKMKRKQK